MLYKNDGKFAVQFFRIPNVGVPLCFHEMENSDGDSTDKKLKILKNLISNRDVSNLKGFLKDFALPCIVMPIREGYKEGISILKCEDNVFQLFS